MKPRNVTFWGTNPADMTKVIGHKDISKPAVCWGINPAAYEKQVTEANAKNEVQKDNNQSQNTLPRK
jgi:hypothetical protein